MENAKEEAEVINSIYENTVTVSEDTNTLLLRIPDTSISVKFWIPLHYPDEPPKVSNVTGVQTADASQSAKLQEIVDSTFVPGEVYMFAFVDVARPLIDEWLAEEQAAKQQAMQILAPYESDIERWTKSEPIRDRHSIFIARCIEAHTEDEVRALLEDVLQDRKIMDATHNMVAWRLKSGDGIVTESSDNDGESGAGAVLSHLLDVADAANVVVVVTRFYGGTHLGPDRFKHIKNCAKDALQKGGFIN